MVYAARHANITNTLSDDVIQPLADVVYALRHTPERDSTARRV